MDKQDEKLLSDILDELKSLKNNKKKDIWDRLPVISTFLSTVVIAAFGSYFTYTYNERQGIRDTQTEQYKTKILEMQTIEKFIPHLTKNEKSKEYALIAITILGNPELATKFAQLSPSEGSELATDMIMRSAPASDQRMLPDLFKAAGIGGKLGWAYVGHFIESKSLWNTRYFDIGPNTNPNSLKGEILTVSEKTGALNIREGMPTITGSFKPVIGVLKPRSKAKIIEVEEWLASGYIWAKIEYGP